MNVSSTSQESAGTVLILGAGIHGTGIARELLLHGIPVVIVDRFDISCGATARSSRLIHGGLRYLEYAEFHLVQESLVERTRMLKLAPHLTHPLRLHIPVDNRLGGFLRGGLRFLRIDSLPLLGSLADLINTPRRGLWTVSAGLEMYDRFSGDSGLPRHAVHNVDDIGMPAVDQKAFHWVVSYSDAQIRYPERLVAANLHDCEQIAAEKGLSFQLLTYHSVRRREANYQIFDRLRPDEPAVFELNPLIVVNATGAWGDYTLRELDISAERMFGGTRGSHFITYNTRLREAIHGNGIYAEAPDGRPIFVLPFGMAVLVGTTDERFEDRPENVRPLPHEMQYLLDAVNRLIPTAELTTEDIAVTYSGVRPLPYTPANAPSAVSRDHDLQLMIVDEVPVITLVGGKLTTWRAFSEQSTDKIFDVLSTERTCSTEGRVIPGGEDFPANNAAVQSQIDEWAALSGYTRDQIAAVWELCGRLLERWLAAMTTPVSDPSETATSESLADVDIPVSFADWVITREWVRTLDDLLERRLLLVYHPNLSFQTIEQLADRMVHAGKLAEAEKPSAIERSLTRLREELGREVT